MTETELNARVAMLRQDAGKAKKAALAALKELAEEFDALRMKIEAGEVPAHTGALGRAASEVCWACGGWWAAHWAAEIAGARP